MECGVRYSLAQAEHFGQFGMCFSTECVDGYDSSCGSKGISCGAISDKYDLQTRDYDYQTGLYVIRYSLTGFRERERSEKTPSKASVRAAMEMFEKDLCFKFEEVPASFPDSYHLHLYGNGILINVPT